MQRKFLSNLAFLIFANLLVKPFWIFGIDRTVQNTVGTVDYGIYFAIFNYTFLFHILLDFGINNFNNRAISREAGRLNEFFSNLIVFKGLLSILYILISFIIGIAIGFDSFHFKLLIFLSINQVLLSLVLYFRSNLAALQLFRTDSVLSILDRLLTIIFCGVLLWGNVTTQPFKIEWFVYVQTLALVLTAFVGFLLTISKVAYFKPQLNKDFIVRIIKSTYPYALLGVLMSIYNRVDAVMIERLLPENGKEEAGIYASAYRLLDAVNMFAFLFATILLPLFSKMVKQKESVNDLLKVSFQTMAFFAILASLPAYFFRDEIMLLLYPAAQEYWARIFGLLIISFIPMSSVYIYGTLLTAKGHLRALNYIALSGLVLNVVLNIVLIFKMGAFGATIATLVTQMLIAFLHIASAHRNMRIPLDYNSFAKLVALIGIIVLFGIFRSYLPFHWIINYLILLGAGIICAFSLKILDTKWIIETFKPTGTR